MTRSTVMSCADYSNAKVSIMSRLSKFSNTQAEIVHNMLPPDGHRYYHTELSVLSQVFGRLGSWDLANQHHYILKRYG